MAYVAGTISDFENRLHELTVSQTILDNFITEGDIYLSSGTSVVWPQTSGKWEREARLKRFQFSLDPLSLTTPQFGQVVGDILDELGQPILDEIAGLIFSPE